MGEDGIKLFALEKSLASVTQHKFRDVRLARCLSGSYRKCEHSSKRSKLVVDCTRGGLLFLPARDVLCHAVARDFDCLVGTEEATQMIDGVFNARQRSPGVCFVIIREHRGQVVKSCLLHVRADWLAVLNLPMTLF